MITVNNVSMNFSGQTLFKDVELKFVPGNCYGIIGANGAGKSTLMKIVNGRLAPDAGSVSLGQNVTQAYYAQHQLEQLNEANTVMQEMDAAAPTWTTSEERRLLGAFLFHGDDVDKRVGVLSGGERARLAMARMMLEPRNLLILDEPTNDLDLATLNILEDYLDSFQGAIIAVSHDRYFLDRITTHLFAVEDARMVPYIGGYQSYLDAQEAKAEASADMKQPAAAKPKDTRVRVQTQLKFSYKEQRDFDTIENRVAELEEKLAQLEQEIAANASNYTKVTELMDTQAKTQQELDEATERWLFLQEKWEQIQAQKG